MEEQRVSVRISGGEELPLHKRHPEDRILACGPPSDCERIREVLARQPIRNNDPVLLQGATASGRAAHADKEVKRQDAFEQVTCGAIGIEVELAGQMHAWPVGDGPCSPFPQP